MVFKLFRIIDASYALQTDSIPRFAKPFEINIDASFKIKKLFCLDSNRRCYVVLLILVGIS